MKGNGTGRMEADDLSVGTRVSEADGTDVVLIASDRESHAEGITVFNFEVEGDHTYFVEDGSGGQSPLWVHNTHRCVGDKFLATYKNKPLDFDNARPATFFKRDDDSYNLIYNEFRSSKRKSWIMRVASDEASVAQLRAAGMTEPQIRTMRDQGTLPSEAWDVHHKQAIKLGGDNNDDNLMIFKDTDVAYHSALTTAQNRIRDEMPNVGDVVERSFPMFDGTVIFNQ